jgi:hypothetical protein
MSKAKRSRYMACSSSGWGCITLVRWLKWHFLWRCNKGYRFSNGESFHYIHATVLLGWSWRNSEWRCPLRLTGVTNLIKGMLSDQGMRNYSFKCVQVDIRCILLYGKTYTELMPKNKNIMNTDTCMKRTQCLSISHIYLDLVCDKYRKTMHHQGNYYKINLAAQMRGSPS